ncbi:hypothetical protein MM1S1530915_4004 [Mycobacteroides abscessus subsp. bolletii 1S-153-0915]|nr:hypothetical protein MM1S1530915_4004 [Mycobacteroides abscessus subsp. bolletii 1S-153-0915]
MCIPLTERHSPRFAAALAVFHIAKAAARPAVVDPGLMGVHRHPRSLVAYDCPYIPRINDGGTPRIAMHSRVLTQQQSCCTAVR